MKRYLTILLAVLCLFAAGCAKESPSATESDPATEVTEPVVQPSPPDEWGITLSVKSVTPASLTIVCTQSGGEPTGELHTGSYYSLERRSEEEWIPVEMLPHDLNIAWTAEAWIIPTEDSVEWQVKWDWLYGELPSGTYRIGKEICDFRGTGDYDTHFCYAEFDIQ